MPGTQLSTQQDLPSWLGPQGFSWWLVCEVGSVLCTFSLVLPRSVPKQRAGDSLLAPSPGGLPGLCWVLVLCPGACLRGSTCLQGSTQRGCAPWSWPAVGPAAHACVCPDTLEARCPHSSLGFPEKRGCSAREPGRSLLGHC